MECQICKTPIAPGYHDKDETTVKTTFGKVFPEGDDLKLIEFVICGWCFEDHIVPLMAGLGVAINWKNQ